MIYITGNSSGSAPSTTAFASRGLTSYTQSQVSKVPLLGKPTQNQLAFSGYKDNIEAFLYATSIKKKVLVSAGHFPIPEDYRPSIPLPLPATVFKLARKPNAEQLKRLKDGLDKFGLGEVQLGKGDPSFTITAPTYKHLANTLPPLCQPRTGNVTGYSQLDSATTFLRVYQCIDLFCAVNTYSYKKGTDTGVDKQDNGGLHTVAEFRNQTQFWREGYGSKALKASVTQDVTERRRIGDDEEEDLTPHRSATTSMESGVYVAKPSPKPSSTSWGSPSEVPFKSGLLFPYFKGMLSPDSAQIREIVGRHFFRNLGSQKVNEKDAYKAFRTAIGDVATSDAGIILTHVLTGIDLALNTQTQLYLIFDDEVYLGFALLGEEFNVFCNGVWTAPLAAEELRDELQTLQTHDKTLDDLFARLRMCVDESGDVLTFEEDEARTMSGLADILAKMKVREEQDDVREVSQILSRLSFPASFKTFRPANLIWAIESLTLQKDQPFPNDVPFYIPPIGWKGIGEKEYKVLASFGPRGPSFRNSTRGVELNIAKHGEDDVFERRDEKGALVYDKFIVGEKVVIEAVKDWKEMVGKRSMRMEFVERQAGSRNHVFKGDNHRVIWDTLKAASQAGHFDRGDYRPDVAPKRSFAVAFGTGSLDDAEF
jgi:hypothetical protein